MLILEDFSGRNCRFEMLFNFVFMAFQFYISIEGIAPSIWRRLIVPGTYNFYQLHSSIQGAFGWENCHMFQFGKTGLSDKVGIGIPMPEDETKVLDANNIYLDRVFKKKKDSQVYIYDFGDYWEHKIVLESIVVKETGGVFCLDGENECPPEDVGGIHGYEEMLECFANGSEKAKNEFRQWLGLKPKENWDPTHFSIRETNKRIFLYTQE
jgi:hypothetical protein